MNPVECAVCATYPATWGWAELAQAHARGHRPEPPPQPSPIDYPVLCAWCEVRGVRTVLRYIAVDGSHGICLPCATAVRATFRRET
jgi:hypothetical protein